MLICIILYTFLWNFIPKLPYLSWVSTLTMVVERPFQGFRGFTAWNVPADDVETFNLEYSLIQIRFSKKATKIWWNLQVGLLLTQLVKFKPSWRFRPICYVQRKGKKSWEYKTYMRGNSLMKTLPICKRSLLAICNHDSIGIFRLNLPLRLGIHRLLRSFRTWVN